jgi:hypothetical protein
MICMCDERESEREREREKSPKRCDDTLHRSFISFCFFFSSIDRQICIIFRDDIERDKEKETVTIDPIRVYIMSSNYQSSNGIYHTNSYTTI